MIYISPTIGLQDHEVQFQATLASGPGGQHVNKTSSAIQLSFDIAHSSLPREVKQRLLRRPDQRISKDGVITIKAQDHRSQLRNKEEALQRLKEFIRPALQTPKARIATKPSRAARKKRLDKKIRHGALKKLRRNPDS